MWRVWRVCSVVVGLTNVAWGQPVAAPPPDPAEWARQRIGAGKVADFDLMCGHVARIAARDPCRTLAAFSLQDLVLAAAAGQRRIDISHAVIRGDIDLGDANVPQEVSLTASLIVGSIDLSRAHFGSRLSFEDSRVGGTLDGSDLHVAGELRLQQAEIGRLALNEADIKGPLNLASARVSGDVSMPNAHVGVDLNLSDAQVRALDASGMQVDGRIYAPGLHASGTMKFDDVVTRGDVWFQATDSSDVSLDSIHVGSTLHMIGGAKFHGLFTLDGANIDHFLDVVDAQFEQGLSGQAIHVGQETKLVDSAFRGIFKLNNARLDGDFTLSGSRFSGAFEAHGLAMRGGMNIVDTSFDGGFDLASARVASTLTAKHVTWSRPANLRLANIGQDLDLSGATLPELDLSGAVIAGTLLLSPAELQPGNPMTCWSARRVTQADCGAGETTARLLNTHVGAVQGVREAWPATLKLSGFTYARINADHTIQERPEDETQAWDHWLRRDQDYSAQPYLQLASALMTDGDRETALTIQYEARERERQSACAAWSLHTCVLLSALSVIAGYGIGDYTWRAVYWVIGLTLLGGACVWWIRRRDKINVLWPFGASLEKLLPYVKLDRSFTEFFENEHGFRLWHKLVFGVLALMGSVLGLFLAAAASGLTQRG